MEFRWVALIALWTLVSGPILGTHSGPVSAKRAIEKLMVKPQALQPARP